MTDEQKMRELEDAIAGYRHTVASLRARLTELENLVGTAYRALPGDEKSVELRPPILSDGRC